MISTSGGSNHFVVYNSNDLLIGGTGNDFYEVLGNGVKVLKDSGGNNGIYVNWAHSSSDFAVKLNGSVLYVAPRSDGVAADLSPNRLVLQNYSVAAYATIRFTTSTGVETFVRTSTLTGLGGGGGRGLTAVDAFTLSDSRSIPDNFDFVTASLEAAQQSSFEHVVGTPIAGFRDPFHGGSTAAQLIEQISAFDVQSAFEPTQHHRVRAFGSEGGFGVVCHLERVALQ